MPAIAATYVSGLSGTVLIDTVAVSIMGWSAKDSVSTWDASTSADGGFTLMERGLRSIEFTFEIPAKTGTVLPAFAVGEIHVAAFSLDGLVKYAGNVIFKEISPKVDLKGGVVFHCVADNHGSMTLS